MADVDATITIPDAHTTTVLEALNGLAGQRLRLSVSGSDGLCGDWEYSYEPKQGGESNINFAQRVIKENIRALVRLFDFIEDEDRFRAEIAAITPASQNVPDDVVT